MATHNRNKANGTRREHKVRDALEADGYLVVRVAGSLGAADLIAFKPGQTLFVQVKSEEYLAPGPWNDLFYTATNVHALPMHAAVLPRKPIIWHQLTAPKTVQTKRPPWQQWTADEAAK